VGEVVLEGEVALPEADPVELGPVEEVRGTKICSQMLGQPAT
jgi:hypothetical protein